MELDQYSYDNSYHREDSESYGGAYEEQVNEEEHVEEQVEEVYEGEEYEGEWEEGEEELPALRYSQICLSFLHRLFNCHFASQ